LKVATWNVNSLRVRLEQVLAWLEAERPDVLALQETKLKDPEFPAEDFAARGYESIYSGQPAYNGVAVLSRSKPREIATELVGLTDPERRLLAATIDGMRVVCLYVPNGQSIDSEKYRYKLEWLGALRAQLAAELARHERCLVLGDFNITPDDRDVHDPKLWAGKVLCSEPERAALRKILALGLDDAFRLFSQPERAFTWWDYRAGALRRNRGLRIDLILTSPPLSRLCAGCRIDVAPRRLARPSDHAPVVAEFRDH
jgi:exodeoxyribonuclease-3